MEPGQAIVFTFPEQLQKTTVASLVSKKVVRNMIWILC